MKPSGLLVQWVIRFPLAAICIAGIIFVSTLPGLWGLQSDFSHRAFFLETDLRLVQFNKFTEKFGNDDSIVVAVHRITGSLNTASWQLVDEVAERLEKIEGVAGIESAASYIDHSLPVASEVPAAVVGTLVSEDHQTTLVIAHLSSKLRMSSVALSARVAAIVEALENDDHSLYVTGTPAITAGFENAARADMALIVPIAIGLMVLVLLIYFRSVISVMIALLSVLMSVVATLGLAGLLGVSMNNLTMAVPQILLSIGMAAAVHLLSSFHQKLKSGDSREEAARYAIANNLRPILLTSVTTAAGFFSLMTAELRPILGLGVLAGMGSILVWCFVIFVGGPLLLLIPRRIVGHGYRRSNDGALSRRYVDFLLAHKKKVYSTWLMLGVAGVIAMSQVTVDSDPIKYFSEDSSVRIATEFIEREVAGVRGVEIVVEADEEGMTPQFLEKVHRYRDWLSAQMEVSRIRGSEPLARAPELFRAGTGREFKNQLRLNVDAPRWIAADQSALRITVLWTLSSAKEVMNAVRKFETELRERGLRGFVTGKTVLYQSMNGHIVSSFSRSILSALVMISVLLSLFLRSLKIGVLALVPNSIPMVIGLLFLWTMSKTLDIGTVVVFSVCLGIAVDDTIHILVAYRGQRDGGALHAEALQMVLRQRAPALILTTFVLVVAFGAFLFGSFIPNVMFGILCAVILSVALLADLSLLLLMLGRVFVVSENS